MVSIRKTIDKFKKIIPYARSPKRYSKIDNYRQQNKWIDQVYTRNKTHVNHFDTLMEAYKNPNVYTCVNVIVDDILDVGWKIVDKKLDRDDTPRCKYLKSMLSRPMNDDMTFSDYLELVLKSYEVIGDAFTYRVLDDEGHLIGLEYISANKIEWSLEKQKWKLKNCDVYFEDDELFHLYDRQIDGSNFGLSKIEVLANDIGMELYAIMYNKEVLEANRLEPTGSITFDGQMDQTAFEEQYDRLEEMSKDKSKRHGTLILQGGVYKNSALTPQDVQFLELLKFIERRAMSVWRIPPQKFQRDEAAHLGNGTGESQDKTYLQNLTSILNRVEIYINNMLRNSGYSEEFVFDELDLETPKIKSDIHRTYLDSSVFTVNEVREDLGKEPVIWGDAPFNLWGNNPFNPQAGVNDGLIDLERSYKNIPEMYYDNIQYEVKR